MKTDQKRYAMLIDLRKCIGCNTCAVVCKSENNVPLGVWRSWVKRVEKGTYPHAKEYALPIVCNNCAKPICVTVCPVKASIQRPDGIVPQSADMRAQRFAGCLRGTAGRGPLRRRLQPRR